MNRNVMNIKNRDDAMKMIDNMSDKSSKDKSILRYRWKQVHEPENIKKYRDTSSKIDKIKKQIQRLDTQIESLLNETCQNKNVCQICLKDSQDSESVCGHIICRSCSDDS